MAALPDYYAKFQGQTPPPTGMYDWSPANNYPTQVSNQGTGAPTGAGGAGGTGAPGVPDPYGNQPNVTGQLDMGKFQDYDPYNPGGSRLYGQLGEMQDYGQGLMQPGSEYYQGLSREMEQSIGKQGAANERAAALRSAYGGLGGGQGAELLATQGDIAQSTLEAQGAAQADLALRAPQVGAQMLQSTFAPELGLQQMGEGSRQYGHGMEEGARQFGAQMGLAQQQMANQRAMQEAQLSQQYEQMQMQADLARQQMEHEFALQQSRSGYVPAASAAPRTASAYGYRGIA